MSSTGEDTGGADGMDKAEDNVGISVSALGGVEKGDPVEVKTERLEAKKAYVDRFYHAPKPTDTDTQPNDEQKEESGQQQQRPQPTGLDQELSVPRQGIALRKSDPAFILGFDIFSEEEIQKRKARAEKFGTTMFDPVTVVDGITREEHERRQRRMARFGMKETKVRVMESVFKYDLPNEPELGPPEDYRYDTIHLYGIHTDFSTKTIYQYFTGYSPMKVEWLNDTSANIVFADPNACKRALTCFSLAIPGELERIRDKEPEHAQREDLEFILWRKAKPCQGHRLLMRVCHKEDVKKPLQDRKPSKWFKKHFKGKARTRRGRVRETGRRRPRDGAPVGRGLRINPRSITIRKKQKRELKKTVDTLHNLKIEVENELAEVDKEDPEPVEEEAVEMPVQESTLEVE
ncbi:hypothetical protein AAMO2058_000957800 [Amorphochlora amoebiformis]